MDVDRYGRLIMRCLAGGTDIAEHLVENGLALAYRRYSTDYVAAETIARDRGLGVWAGTFEAPWDWRRRH
jgi:endonuclease YncB( thermonuclease family)